MPFFALFQGGFRFFQRGDVKHAGVNPLELSLRIQRRQRGFAHPRDAPVPPDNPVFFGNHAPGENIPKMRH